MKFESEGRLKKNQARDARKTFIVLAGVLLATSVYVLVQQLYLLRELLLVVACAAILVFFAQTLRRLEFCFMRQDRIFGGP